MPKISIQMANILLGADPGSFIEGAPTLGGGDGERNLKISDELHEIEKKNRSL